MSRPSSSSFRAPHRVALVVGGLLGAGCQGIPAGGAATDAPSKIVTPERLEQPVTERWLEQGLPEVTAAEVFALNPVQFLDALQTTDGFWVTVMDDAPAGWLDAQYVPALMARLDSDDSCPHIISRAATMLPSIDDGPSSVGYVARYMLEGYRDGRFPVEGGSASHPVWTADEARTWWAARASDAVQPAK